MTPMEVLESRLAAAGVSVTVSGAKVVLKGSTGKLSRGLVEDIKDAKPELLRRRAWELVGILDGPGPYETRIAYMPEYQAIVQALAEAGP